MLLVMLSPVIYAVWIIFSARLSGERPDRFGSDADAPSSTAAQAVDRPSTASREAAGAGDAAVTTAVMMTATTAVFVLLGVLLGRPIDPRVVPVSAWPGLLAIGFVASFLAIQTFYAGTRRIGAAQAALVSTVEPVYIVVLAAVLLDQRLAPIQLVGTALILAGVVIAQTAPRPRGAPQPARPLDAEG
jgi:drug/metabolite transporter (DMT)-like permease